MPLSLPSSVCVELRLPDRSPLRMPKVLFAIQTFATHKNDISMFPFATEDDGVARITRDLMRAEISATYDSGLMDYASIESAYDMIEVRIASVSEIERVIESRSKSWTSLLKGERERWKNMDELLELLRSANNRELDIPDALSLRPKVRDSWSDPTADKRYEVYVRQERANQQPEPMRAKGPHGSS